jgi:ABC-2 type transport system permease protein
VNGAAVKGSAVNGRLELLNPVVFKLTLRATLGRRRALIFMIAPVLLLAITVLLKVEAHSPVWPPEFLGIFGYTVVVPLTALIIGTSVLGAEIDDSSVISVLATPVRRSTVVLTKFAVAALLTLLFAAVAEYLAGAIATGPGSKLALGLLAGAAVASVVYNALFVMLSVLTTRAIAVGLLYLLVWEGLLSNLVGGVRLLSVDQYALGIANGVAHNQSLNAHLTLGTGIGVGAVITCLALAFASRRLASFSLKGDAA